MSSRETSETTADDDNLCHDYDVKLVKMAVEGRNVERERKATDVSELTTLIRPLPITRAALLTGETPSHAIIAALRPVAPVAIPAEI